MEPVDPYDVAASSIRKAAELKLSRGLIQSALIPLQGNEQTKQVVEDWLAKASNLEELPYSIDPSSFQQPSTRRWFPMVFSNRITATSSRELQRDKCIVLIALEDLTLKNGLPYWKNGPSTIAKGGWSFFKIDEELGFGETGGGLAIWLELKIL